MAYKSSYTGPQIDQAVGNALNKDTTTLSNDVNRIPASSVVKSALNTVDESIAIRVSGDKTAYASGAAIGQYVIVDGSTIAGITDGLYKAAKAIPYNTGIDSTYLKAVSGGGFNDLKSALSKKIDVSENYTTATTLADTGVSVTIPANSVYCINARTGYVSTAPNMIALVLGSGAANSAIAYSERNADMNNVSCSFCGFTGSAAVTVHVFAKCSVADRTNIATISGFYAAY